MREPMTTDPAMMHGSHLLDAYVDLCRASNDNRMFPAERERRNAERLLLRAELLRRLTAPDAPSGTTKDHILRATVTEELIARMADTIGMDIDRLNAVLDGRANFGDSAARKFRMYFGTSKEFWMNLAIPAPGGPGSEADHG